MTEYKVDFVAWAEEQGRLLRERRLDLLDRANIAKEIKRLGEADIEVMRERIRILLTALLRWAFEVDLRSVGLSSTILTQRIEIERLLDDSPSLRTTAADLVIETYPAAKRAAVMESGLFEESFPEGLPFLPSEVFDLTFLPDPFGDDAVRGPDWWRRRHGDGEPLGNGQAPVEASPDPHGR